MIKSLYKKYKQIILYVFFGFLTTIVNFVTYFLCKAVGIRYEIATVIAWICSVLFAFVTNKIIVFESKTSKKQTVAKEITLFFGGRVFSLLLELMIMKIGMDFIHADRLVVFMFERNLPLGEFLTKLTAGIVVLITNFLISKFIIFRKKKGGEADENISD
ncbi:MAG: GtrA family protein [Clostridiales bacterium]|nr:GtrA family protein [Clostridiales bacterium]